MEERVEWHLHLLQHPQAFCRPQQGGNMDPLPNIQVEKGEMRAGLSLVRAELLHSNFQGHWGLCKRFLFNLGSRGRALMWINLPWVHWPNLHQNTMWVCSFPYIPTTITTVPLSSVSWESLFACFPESVFPFFFVLFAQRCDQSPPLWGFHFPRETSQNQHCLAWYLSNVHVNFQ